MSNWNPISFITLKTGNKWSTHARALTMYMTQNISDTPKFVKMLLPNKPASSFTIPIEKSNSESVGCIKSKYTLWTMREQELGKKVCFLLLLSSLCCCYSIRRHQTFGDDDDDTKKTKYDVRRANRVPTKKYILYRRRRHSGTANSSCAVSSHERIHQY